MLAHSPNSILTISFSEVQQGGGASEFKKKKVEEPVTTRQTWLAVQYAADAMQVAIILVAPFHLPHVCPSCVVVPVSTSMWQKTRSRRGFVLN